MRKRYGLLLAGLVLLVLLWTPEAARADRIEMKVTYYVAHGETILPDYPDYSSQIGAGLTKEDFKITYETAGGSVLVDPDTGALTGNPEGPYDYDNLYITYTPVRSGVGKKTVYHCYVYTNPPLTSIKLSKDELLMNDTGSDWVVFRFNDKKLPPFRVTGYDERVVSVSLSNRGREDTEQTVSIHAVSPGETTVTVVAYNGVSADIHVTVKRTPTEVSFAQEEYVCYVGDKISLGIDYGGSEYHPDFYLSVRADPSPGSYDFEDDIYGRFCPLKAADYSITIHRGSLEAMTLVRVYDAEPAVTIKSSSTTIRNGDWFQVVAYDANGKALRVKAYEITKGEDVVQWKNGRLVATGTGEFEISVTNRDGSVCRQAFVVEPRPTQMTLNAKELTLELGDSFEIKATFDQGQFPLYCYAEYVDQSTQVSPIRLIGNTIIAQRPGTQYVEVRAENLTGQISVTVRDSNRLTTIQGPDTCPVGQPVQLYVTDKTGKIYPATFATESRNDDYCTITPGGCLTVKRLPTWPVKVTATLADGRTMIRSFDVIQVPSWLECDSMILTEGSSSGISVRSDVGYMALEHLTVEVADETIATSYGSGIKGLKIGTTAVTVRSAYNPEVSTSFTVEVIPNTSNLYLGKTTIRIPAGSLRPLPVVYNGNGQEVPMIWKVTHEDAGNPEGAFVIEDGMIYCNAAGASCELTGTVKGGTKKVKVTVYGFALPEVIRIDPVQIWLEPGGQKTITLVTDEPVSSWGITYWESADPEIVTIPAYSEQNTNTLTAVGPGETMVGAMLENGAIAMCLVNVYDRNERLPGDVNEDGRVDANDALIVMQYCAGWPVVINGWQGNVDGNSRTDMDDALLIFQHASGMDVQLRRYIPPES